MNYPEAVHFLMMFKELSNEEQLDRKWEAVPAFRIVWNEAPTIEEFDRVVGRLVLSGGHLWIVGKEKCS